MSISSYLIRVRKADKSGWVNIPLALIAYETYKITPNQMIDLDSYVAETGYLIRNVLDHARTKIEFNTPYCNDTQWRELWGIISQGFTDEKARKCTIQYYNPLKGAYQTATCYVPDVDLTIRNIDMDEHIINYDPIRVAFIEY